MFHRPIFFSFLCLIIKYGFRAIRASSCIQASSFTYKEQVQNITDQVVWCQREILDSRQTQDDHETVLCGEMDKDWKVAKF